MEEPLVARDTDKVRFFRNGEDWHDAWPRDYKPIDQMALRREQKERRQIHEEARQLKPVCLVCGEEIPAHHPDYLVTDSETGQKAVAHVECSEVADAPGWKLRHCVGGLEVEEQ